MVAIPILAYFNTPHPWPNNQCIYDTPGMIPPGPIKAFYATERVSEEQELEGLQVPVPRSCRILNTKGNCVWCSMELAARYAEITSLYNITKNVRDGGDLHCQGGSSPEPVREFLKLKHIRYDMIDDKKDVNFLIQHCKLERRPVCFAIPGHMLSLVHIDPDAKIIKVIDNADRSLSVQQWPWEKFFRIWSGWAYVIYGEPDLIPYKYDPWARIPIIDGERPFIVPPEYIPIPK